MSRSQPNLAVCMTVWNRGDLLAASLRSLFHCLDDVDFTIWLVDNGSDRATTAVIDRVCSASENVFALMLPSNMGIPHAMNLFGATAVQECSFANHHAPDYIAILDPDMIFRRPFRELIHLLERDPSMACISGHDSPEHPAVEIVSKDTGSGNVIAKLKSIERGCFLMMRKDHFINFIPFPHHLPHSVDWRMARDHELSFVNTGRTIVCIDSSIHLGLFDSTWSPEGVPATSEQVHEIIDHLSMLDLLTADRRQRAQEYLERNNMFIELPSASSPSLELATTGADEAGLTTLSSYEQPDDFSFSAWHEHAPFAFYLMEKVRPNVLVELGTYHGFSYFCFCQAVSRHELPTACYAIDTWQGDEHSGGIDETVYDSVMSKNNRYSRFSQLIKSSFSDAVARFDDSSVDILHIDGRHYYDDVQEDFYTWLPKMKSDGIVLFHDTAVRERGFGVGRFFNELGSRYRTLEFQHGYGLGVVALGEVPSALTAIFANPDHARQIYARLGRNTSQRWQLQLAQSHLTSCQNETRLLRDQTSTLASAYEEYRTASELAQSRLTSCQNENRLLRDQTSTLASAYEEYRTASERHLSAIESSRGVRLGRLAERAASRLPNPVKSLLRSLIRFVALRRRGQS